MTVFDTQENLLTINSQKLNIVLRILTFISGLLKQIIGETWNVDTIDQYVALIRKAQNNFFFIVIRRLSIWRNIHGKLN